MHSQDHYIFVEATMVTTGNGKMTFFVAQGNATYRYFSSYFLSLKKEKMLG
jgi:hypothetical protein